MQQEADDDQIDDGGNAGEYPDTPGDLVRERAGGPQHLMTKQHAGQPTRGPPCRYQSCLVPSVVLSDEAASP